MIFQYSVNASAAARQAVLGCLQAGGFSRRAIHSALFQFNFFQRKNGSVHIRHWVSGALGTDRKVKHESSI